MTLPVPKYMRRVAQIGQVTMGRFFRLKPSPEVNRTIGYLLAHYAAKHKISVHAAVFMGNHYHLLVSAAEPTLNAFKRDFNAQIARYLNAREKVVGVKVWAPSKPADIECLDPESALDDIIYISLNPVQAWIAPRPSNHPGFVILPSDWGKPMSFEPPETFFQFAERDPEPITLTPTPPPGYLDEDLEALKRKVMHDIDMRARRIRRNAPGFYGYEDVSVWDCPESLKARRAGYGLDGHFPSCRFKTLAQKRRLFVSCPRYQATDKALVARAFHEEEAFQREYARCRQLEKSGGTDVVFPEGTAAYRQHHRARCAPLVDRGWYPLLNYL